MTVRQVFYALTVRGVIEKTEAEYRQRSLGLVDYLQPRLVVAMPVLFVALPMAERTGIANA